MIKKLMIPKKGVLIRDPLTSLHLKPEGEIKALTSYYTRRKNDGDLEISEVPEKKTAEKKSKPESNGVL